MKKLILLALVLFSSISLFAEKKVASYTLFGEEKEIEAYVNKKGELCIFIEVLGEYKNDRVMINVDGDKNITALATAWKEVKEKFIEWLDVAKKNNVTNFNKEYPTTFPRCQIWWTGTKWRSTYTGSYLKPRFMVLEDGTSSTTCGGTAKDYDNQYITQKWYQIFQSPDEIQTLIDALDPQQIRKVLDGDVEADALFQ